MPLRRRARRRHPRSSSTTTHTTITRSIGVGAAVVALASVDAVNVDPDGALVVLSRNVRDLQIELPRLAQAAGIRLRRVEPLDDSLESVFGYLVES